MLKRVYLAAGRPAAAEHVIPALIKSKSGLVSMAQIQHRADKAWTEAKLERITFQECRHTGATWLDAAGVSPRIASVWMGHAVPAHQPGAATITLARYTHALTEDVIAAGDRLTAYLQGSVRRATV